jgi:hypothetical protein
VHEGRSFIVTHRSFHQIPGTRTSYSYMSIEADRCVAASREGDWETAFYYLNGLNMYEMLRCLASLSRFRLTVLHHQLFRFADTYNVSRIDYAIHVVIERILPIPPPGDLHETGQDKTAQEFIDETRVPAPAPPYSPPVLPPPGVEPQRKYCGGPCPYCDKTCNRKFLHEPPHMCPLGHTWT